jgi:hypothetical protein
MFFHFSSYLLGIFMKRNSKFGYMGNREKKRFYLFDSHGVTDTHNTYLTAFNTSTHMAR